MSFLNLYLRGLWYVLFVILRFLNELFWSGSLCITQLWKKKVDRGKKWQNIAPMRYWWETVSGVDRLSADERRAICRRHAVTRTAQMNPEHNGSKSFCKIHIFLKHLVENLAKFFWNCRTDYSFDFHYFFKTQANWKKYVHNTEIRTSISQIKP